MFWFRWTYYSIVAVSCEAADVDDGVEIVVWRVEAEGDGLLVGRGPAATPLDAEFLRHLSLRGAIKFQLIRQVFGAAWGRRWLASEFTMKKKKKKGLLLQNCYGIHNGKVLLLVRSRRQFGIIWAEIWNMIKYLVSMKNKHLNFTVAPTIVADILRELNIVKYVQYWGNCHAEQDENKSN